MGYLSPCPKVSPITGAMQIHASDITDADLNCPVQVDEAQEGAWDSACAPTTNPILLPGLICPSLPHLLPVLLSLALFHPFPTPFHPFAGLPALAGLSMSANAHWKALALPQNACIATKRITVAACGNEAHILLALMGP